MWEKELIIPYVTINTKRAETETMFGGAVTDDWIKEAKIKMKDKSQRRRRYVFKESNEGQHIWSVSAGTWDAKSYVLQESCGERQPKPYAVWLMSYVALAICPRAVGVYNSRSMAPSQSTLHSSLLFATLVHRKEMHHFLFHKQTSHAFGSYLKNLCLLQ